MVIGGVSESGCHGDDGEGVGLVADRLSLLFCEDLVGGRKGGVGVAGVVGVAVMAGEIGVMGVAGVLGCCSSPIASPLGSCSLSWGSVCPKRTLPLHASTVEMASPFELYPPTRYT